MPRNDPRVLKQYVTIEGTWQPSGTVGTVSAQIPPYLKQKIRARLPGWTVNIPGNGWGSDGLIHLEVIVPNTTSTAGKVKGAFFDATSDYNEDGLRPGGKGSLINPITFVDSSDIKLPPAATTPDATPGATPPVTPTADGSTTPPVTTGITSTVSGIPMWVIGVGAVGVVGLLGFLALSGGKKKAAAPAAAPAAAVAANRRRRYRRAA
jgi:hypothetical protein